MGTANALKPVSRSFGFVTQPLELPARPADDIGIDPLEGRTQVRPIEVAVVVDPAFDVRIVHLGQILQGLVAVMVKCRIARLMDVSAFGRAAGRKPCVWMSPCHSVLLARNENPRKSNDWLGKSPRRFASLQ